VQLLRWRSGGPNAALLIDDMLPPARLALGAESIERIPCAENLDRGPPRGHHADVMRDGKFVLTMRDRKSEVNFCWSFRCACSERGAAMKSSHRSILTRALMTGVASLAFVMVSAGGVRADIVTVQGANGAAGSDASNTGNDAQSGGDGESVSANAGSTQPITAPQNQAIAGGGGGGQGGNGVYGDTARESGGAGGNGGAANAAAFTTIVSGAAGVEASSYGGGGGGGGTAAVSFGFGMGGSGGNGGSATATGGATTISGAAEANANANGGPGGSYGAGSAGGGDGAPGAGGSASATSTAMTVSSGAALSSANATGGAGNPEIVISQFPAGNGGGGGANAQSTAISGLSGDATSSATANGGSGHPLVGPGGDATASSAATSNGSGNASSSATATGGEAGFDAPLGGGGATAMADASATGGGTAKATAVATGGVGGAFEPSVGTVSATSTAKSTFTVANVRSTDEAVSASTGSGTYTTNAVAQAGGFDQTFVKPDDGAYAFSSVLPDKAGATLLIGGASAVASALLGPSDTIFGTAILGADSASQSGDASSTFDFHYQGDLLLGLIDGFQEFNVTVNGVQVLDGDFVEDSVINLGSNFGPNIDLTIVTYGSGEFVFGGAVPETSTWAMMLLGFAGLGYAGYRGTREPRAA
jgi:hypothetical protein